MWLDAKPQFSRQIQTRRRDRYDDSGAAGTICSPSCRKSPAHAGSNRPRPNRSWRLPRARAKRFLTRSRRARLSQAHQQAREILARRRARLRGRQAGAGTDADAQAGRRPKAQVMQSDKDGVEIDQGIFLAQVLAHAGSRHASLPRHAAAEHGSGRALPRIHQARHDRSRPGAGRAPRQGGGRHRQQSALPQRRGRRHARRDRDRRRHRILDPTSEICVLRGDVVEHPKYAGRSIFSAGINLTHLYHGKIPFLWFLRRDMGFVNKMLRGLAMGRAPARRGLRRHASRSPGSPASRSSPSAAAASICWRWTTWSPAATPT